MKYIISFLSTIIIILAGIVSWRGNKLKKVKAQLDKAETSNHLHGIIESVAKDALEKQKQARKRGESIESEIIQDMLDKPSTGDSQASERPEATPSKADQAILEMLKEWNNEKDK